MTDVDKWIQFPHFRRIPKNQGRRFFDHQSYKMIELVDMFDLLENVSENMKSFHIAEGPGGFIEALVMKRNNINDRYVGMSLIDDKDDKNIPGWNKSKQFLDLEKNENVFIVSIELLFNNQIEEYLYDISRNIDGG